jgi:hypothetical protein
LIALKVEKIERGVQSDEVEVVNATILEIHEVSA